MTPEPATPTRWQARKDRPPVRLEPSRYQPSKAELEETISVPPGTTPEALVRAVCRTVNIVYED